MTGDGGGASVQGNGKQAQVHHLPAVLSRLVVEQAPFGLVLVDAKGMIQWANDGFWGLLGTAEVDREGGRIGELVRRSGLLGGRHVDWTSLGESWEPVYLATGNEEAEPLVLASMAPIVREQGGRWHLLSFIEAGTSDAKAVHGRGRRPARLPNTWLFEDRLGHALERAARAGGRVGLLVLRLDRHESLRNILEPEALEALVGRVEWRLARTLRREDSLVKLRPGCWGVLIEPPLSPGGLQATVMRCLEAMEPPFQLEAHPTLLTLSAGIAIYPEDGESSSQLLASAEAALERAAPSRHAFFDDALRRHLDDELAFRQQLQEALMAPEAHFELLFQPQIELTSGRCVGLEALVRWRHSHRGLLRPTDFLPVVAELEQQVRLDRWVLSAVIAQHAAWQAEGSPLGELGVAVNAGSDLLDQAVFDRRPLDVFLRQQGLEPGWLSLELALSGLADGMSEQAHLLRRLERLGVGLVVNDVGAQPLDLSSLASLAVTRIKLSPTLMTSLERGGVLEALLRCLEVLRLEAVLVGLETPAHLEAARQLGVSLGQGYLLGAPQAPADLMGWWQARPTLA